MSYTMIPPLSPEGLSPPGRHTCTTETVRLHFVDTFSMTNRRQLYDEWLAYTNRLQALLRVKSLVQWVDGSFVTDKPNPGDLDVVTFLPYTAYEPAEDALIEFYSTVNLHERGLDAYSAPFIQLITNGIINIDNFVRIGSDYLKAIVL